MKKIILTIALLAGMGGASRAQNNPLLNQYYGNRYLANPAMAGVERGGSVDLGYRSQWTGITGAPKIQALTANYGWERVGLGLNANLDQAGLQKQVRVLASYAYHLPLNSNGLKLHFGLSAGIMNQRIEQRDIIGDANDSQVGNYNARRTYFDGDFGMGLSNEKFSAELALVNLKNYFKKDEFSLLSTPRLYATAGYKFDLGDSNLQPKIAYRMFTEQKDLVDAGLQWSVLKDQLLLTGMYHSSKSASFGLGINFKRKLFVQSSYTTQTSALSNYTNGSFEINLGLKW